MVVPKGSFAENVIQYISTEKTADNAESKGDWKLLLTWI